MLRFKKFSADDIEVLTPIMKAAFDEDSRIHLGGVGGPSGYDNGDFFRKWFLNQYATAYTIYEEDEIIGAINLWIHKNNHNSLGCIFLDPSCENKGYGKRVWDKVESLFPDTISWHTETPIFSHRNHNFYINKCGFKCVKIENPKDLNEGQFILEKIMK